MKSRSAFLSRSIFALIFLSIIIDSSYACLNGETKEAKDGTLFSLDWQSRTPRGHIFTFTPDDGFEKRLERFDSLYKATGDPDYLSDKGLVLIVMKEYHKAIQLYLDLESQFPNRYSTASNIGTAYELIGQSEKALDWIKKAVSIDPTSHHSSEWIHVKILEAKIGGDDLVTSEHLLNVDFGEDDYPQTNLTTKQLEDLYLALFFQLNERLSFIKTEDKVVAQLLFELGNIELLLHHASDALEDFHAAAKYGFDSDLLAGRIGTAHDGEPKEFNVELFLVSGGGIASLILIATVIYLLRSRQSYGDQV